MPSLSFWTAARDAADHAFLSACLEVDAAESLSGLRSGQVMWQKGLLVIIALLTFLNDF